MPAIGSRDGTSASKSQITLEDLLASRPEVADEIQALQAIFGESKLTLPCEDIHLESDATNSLIRLVLETSLPSHEDVEVAFIITLPGTYPSESPPTLQLSSRYIGDFAVESALFGSITRTFMRDDVWRPGEVAVFEGIERAREECDAFLNDKLSELEAKKAGDYHTTQEDLEYARQMQYEEDLARSEATPDLPPQQGAKLPEGCKLFTSEPITDRKSIFIGHACRIKSPADVSEVVNYLLSDRKIAKATHPAMLAYRVRGKGGIIHQDNDDDGESAAGSRLAHLLQILDLDDVLVVVSRWFGGIHLGSDRFKHINQAARDALVAGNFVQGKAKR